MNAPVPLETLYKKIEESDETFSLKIWTEAWRNGVAYFMRNNQIYRVTVEDLNTHGLIQLLEKISSL